MFIPTLRHRRTFLCLSLLASVTASPVFAQQPDLATFRGAAQAALGGAVQGIEFTGAGWDACMGQAWSVAEGWARWELADYRRVIDYDDVMSAHSTQRRPAMDPGRIGGCGAQPTGQFAPQQGFIDGSSPWVEQLTIWLTPHGFLQLAENANATLAREGNGWQLDLPYTHDGIAYRFVGEFNDDYELETLTTWVDDGIFGDMEVRAEFGDYRNFGAVNFPATLEVNQGGFPVLSLEIAGASSNAETLVKPERRAGGAAAAAGPAYTEIGDGVFAIHGSYQAVAVEFADFTVVIDGLQSDARVQQLIGIVKDAIPNKPIRYVVSTHSHFDHAYGLRQFAAEGATILTHEMNVAFFQEALSTPRTLRGANATEPNVVPVKIEGIDGRYEISDGNQVIELHALGPSAHAADMIVAYLPALKTIVEADILQPWINPVFAGNNGPHPFLVYLADELGKAGIDYERFVPIHVPPEPPLMQRSDLEAVLGTAR